MALREIGIFDHMDRPGDDLPAFFESRLALTQLYDRLGFYSYHVAEHHFTPLGMASSPNVYLAMVAARTLRLRFGSLIYVLPLYHPLRLLEEICLLDQASNGRIDVGFGRGISAYEAEYYGSNAETSQRIFEETLSILRQGLTSSHLTFSGEFYQFDVPLEMKPRQQPRPPLWYGVSAAESAARCARDGINVITLNAPRDCEPVIAAHLGAGDGSLLAGIGRFVVVAGTDAEALAIAESAYARWYHNFNFLHRRFGRSPVQGERPTTFAGVIEKGTGVAGSPATVRAALEAQIRQTGCNYLVGQFAFGDLPHADAARSIELFAAEVMPHLLGRAPETMAGMREPERAGNV